MWRASSVSAVWLTPETPCTAAFLPQFLPMPPGKNFRREPVIKAVRAFARRQVLPIFRAVSSRYSLPIGWMIGGW
jgi:hypothetical protein